MIYLRAITRDNYRACLRLRVKQEQQSFVASNAVSLAQSKYEPECIPLAIYDDETMVGFTMYCIDAEVNTYYIYRLMIDAGYQSRGYGFKAMKLLMDRITVDPNYHKIYIDCEPENKAAKNLYTKLGFVITDELREGDNIIMKYEY
ncbi:MAG TPA: spermidine acetyltransferase [Clostridiales bacterium]|nr:spermidine acetyltransferase [Clostridiales bacterium]